MRISRKNKGIKRNLKRTKKRGGVSAVRKQQPVEKSSNKQGKLTLNLRAVEQVRVQENRKYNDMQFLKEKQKINEAAIKGNKNYTRPEKGVEQIDQSPNEVHEGFKRMDDDEEYFRLQRKGLTFSGKTRKKKKEFLYNPNDPSKSFDVYINKNPSDTIPIKYTTVKDVRETISNLERLYKNKKYPHKRIWQVAMIMKVRLEAMKKHKKTRYPNAKNVTSRYNLANKYFKKLGKRSKELAKKRRTRKRKGGIKSNDSSNKIDEQIKMYSLGGIEKISLIVGKSGIKKVEDIVRNEGSVISDIIMESLKNDKKNIQEKFGGLIIELLAFLTSNSQSGGKYAYPNNNYEGLDNNNQYPRINNNRVVRQVVTWDEFNQEDLDNIERVGANPETINNLMRMGMTVEQLRQAIRNIDQSIIEQVRNRNEEVNENRNEEVNENRNEEVNENINEEANENINHKLGLAVCIIFYLTIIIINRLNEVNVSNDVSVTNKEILLHILLLCNSLIALLNHDDDNE